MMGPYLWTYFIIWVVNCHMSSASEGHEGSEPVATRITSHQDHGRPPDHALDTGTMYGMNDTYHNGSESLLCENLPAGERSKCLCKVKKCIMIMDDSCQAFQFVVSFVLVGLTCLFGLVGNVLSILTLQRDSIKSVTTFLLSALAVADFAFLIPAVFVIMIPTYCEFYQHCVHAVKQMIPHFEQYGWAIASTTHSCTVYVTVLVAIHRYLWVCKPELAQKFSGLGRAKFQVALVPICALIYNSPRFVEYKVYHVVGNYSTEARMETIKDLAAIGKDKYFQIFYKNVAFFVIMYLIPLTILIMVSVNLIRTLRQRRATLQRIGSTNSNASQSRRDDNVTFVLIIIIAAFIICQTPTMLQRLLLAAAKKEHIHSCGHPYFYLEHIADYMALLNSSTNFVIYILFSPHFRRTLNSEVLCKSSNASTALALRQLSRFSKNKKSSDEKKSSLLKDTHAGDQNDKKSSPNGQVTFGRQSSSGKQQSNGQATANYLSPPDHVIDKHGSVTVSTQVTSHEYLTSHEEADDGDERHDKPTSTTPPERRSINGVTTTDADVDGEVRVSPGTATDEPGTSRSFPDEEREIQIPLIAFEQPSSVVLEGS